jgi:putative transposase
MSFPRQVVPGRVYLVTRRCTQRQFLLRPDSPTTNAFLYCLGYAAIGSGIAVVAVIANSNHYHAVVVDRNGCIPEFLETFHKLVAKHQNVLRERRENFWASEQTSLVELVGKDDVFAKVIYTLTNPVKDHLVARAIDWPGASSRAANLTGTTLRAVRPAVFFRSDGDMPDAVEIECTRAPGHEALNDDEYQRMLADAIARVEADAAAERKRTGRQVMGVEAVLAQSPFDRPSSKEPRRELNPRIAAQDKGALEEAIKRVKTFRGRYASVRPEWLTGKDVTFPFGSYWLPKFAGVRCEKTFSGAQWDDPPREAICAT